MVSVAEFPAEIFNYMFGHVNDVGAGLVMLNNHFASLIRRFQLNCLFEPIHLFNIQLSIGCLVVLKPFSVNYC